eukprot:CAMPEP_0194219836 /NCGR_PEP_ID=MMETSP0156-20130528/26974_1 /TAXON_ID=33649 /ORGANISM="Thalassionema nitzschioides, Strain L26-B" /LENGTH=455 /DNA_ID=CAMNT_0038949647 /DNA_START=35 /DNA_END=1402 /DNA_ORIENTATION=+
MTSIAYPTFKCQSPGASQAVGKCRIYPEDLCKIEFRSIVQKNIEQANVDVEDKETKDANKKLRKKYMKEGVGMAKKLLMETLNLDVSIVDVEIYVNPEDIIDSDGCLAACLLDAGCHAIVTDGSSSKACDIAKIPRDRLVSHFEVADSASEIMEAIREAASFSSVISIEFSSATVETLQNVLQQQTKEFDIVIQIHPQTITDNVEQLASTVGTVLSVCKDGHGAMTLIDPSPSQVGLSYAACMRTDRPDGLFTTVVCNRSGEALGLVYSSKESIVAALECGRGVYYSRSRNGLWRKGDTSGHYQILHRLDVDCDSDALRFTVTQRGDPPAFCHLNTLTCWGEPRGLRHLEQTLSDRLQSAPEGSYTKRLFDDPELLRDKLVEEAQELSEANDKVHVAEELADVLYFAMTKAIKAGISIDDAVAELDRRTRKVTRRKGDSKAFRIAAGNEILNKEE